MPSRVLPAVLVLCLAPCVLRATGGRLASAATPVPAGPIQDRKPDEALRAALTEGRLDVRLRSLRAQLERGEPGVAAVAALLDAADWGRTHRLLQVIGSMGEQAASMAEPVRSLLRPRLKETAKRLQVYGCLIRLGALGSSAAELVAEERRYRAAVVQSLRGLEASEKSFAALLAACTACGKTGEDFVLEVLATIAWDQEECQALALRALAEPPRRLAALGALQNWQGGDPGLCRALVALLADPECADPATVVLQHCGQPEPVLAALLKVALRSRNEDQALRASLLVALRDSDRPLGAESVGAALRRGTTFLGRAAVEYCNRHPDLLEPLRAELLALCDAEDDDLRHQAILVLLRDGSGGGRFLPQILAWAARRTAKQPIQGEDLTDLWFLLDAAGRVGAPAMPILMASLGWKGDGFGFRTINALQRCGPAAAPALGPLLARARNDEEGWPGSQMDQLLAGFGRELRAPQLRPLLHHWLTQRLAEDPRSALGLLLVLTWAVPRHAEAVLALAAGEGPLVAKALACLADATGLSAEHRPTLRRLAADPDPRKQGLALLALGRTGADGEDLAAWLAPLAEGESIPNLARLEVLASWLPALPAAQRKDLVTALAGILAKDWSEAVHAVARGLVRCAGEDRSLWRGLFAKDLGLRAAAFESLREVTVDGTDLLLLLRDATQNEVAWIADAMRRCERIGPDQLPALVDACRPWPNLLLLLHRIAPIFQGPEGLDLLAGVLNTRGGSMQIRQTLPDLDGPGLHRIELVERIARMGGKDALAALLNMPPPGRNHPAEDFERWCAAFTAHADMVDLAQARPFTKTTDNSWVRALAMCGPRGLQFLERSGVAPRRLQDGLYENLMAVPMIERRRWRGPYLEHLVEFDNNALLVFRQAIVDPDAQVRAAILRRMIPLWPKAEAWHGDLLKLVGTAASDLSSELRRRAQDWIGSVRPPFALVSALCTQGLEDRDPKVVDATLSTLLLYGAEARSLRAAVEALDPGLAGLDEEGRRSRAALLASWSKGP